MLLQFMVVVFSVFSSLSGGSAEASIHTRSWQPSWSRTTEAGVQRYASVFLDKSFSKMSAFCPRYDRLGNAGKMEFWKRLVQGVAYLVSGHRPNSSFREPFSDRSGQRVVSRGLLQLSTGSVKGYTACGSLSASALHNPHTNLKCGIAIMAHWLSQDKTLYGGSKGRWRGLARYWSQFRVGKKRQRLQAYTQAMKGCR